MQHILWFVKITTWQDYHIDFWLMLHFYYVLFLMYLCEWLQVGYFLTVDWLQHCWCFLSFCGVSDFFSFSLFTLLVLSDILFFTDLIFYKFQIQVTFFNFSIYPLVSLIVFLNWEIESEIKHLNSLIFLCAELRYPFSCLFSSCSC